MKIVKKLIITCVVLLNVSISIFIGVYTILGYLYGEVGVELPAIMLMFIVIYWVVFFYLLKKTKQNTQDELNQKYNSWISILLIFVYIFPSLLFFGGLTAGKMFEIKQRQDRAQWEKENCVITTDKNSDIYKCNNGEVFVKIKPLK